MRPQIFLHVQNQVYGPYEFAHVQAGVQRGEITPQHSISYDGRQYFPAAAIWPQLLGQAGFAAPAPAAHAPQAARSAVPRAVSRAVPIAQAQPVAQGIHAADGEFTLYSSWPGYILAMLFALVLLGCIGDLSLLLMAKLYTPEEMSGSTAARVIRAASIALRLVGPSAAVLYLTFWVYRAAQRMWDKGVEALAYSPSWACAWFYIPILNVVMPALVLQNLWKSSDWTARTRRATGTPLIPVWWGSWIVCRLFWGSKFAWKRYFDAAVMRGKFRLDNDGDAWAFGVIDHFDNWTGMVYAAETVAWSLALILFLMFDARVKTRVEMQ